MVIGQTVSEATILEEIKRETQEDELLQKVIQAIKMKQSLGKEQEIQPYAAVFLELSTVSGLVLRGERLVIPRSLQKKFVEAVHESYQGITKTKSYLRSRVWFPGMDALTETTARGCMACQVVTPQTLKLPLKMTPLPDGVMEKVAADFYGPLPTGEYLLSVGCKYSRYSFIEVVMSTSAKAVIPKFERIFSKF